MHFTCVPFLCLLTLGTYIVWYRLVLSITYTLFYSTFDASW
jgi:hypothetical protein